MSIPKNEYNYEYNFKKKVLIILTRNQGCTLTGHHGNLSRQREPSGCPGSLNPDFLNEQIFTECL